MGLEALAELADRVLERGHGVVGKAGPVSRIES